MNYYQVVTPPITKKLTTLERVKNELEITSSGLDTYLNNLITEASSLIEQYTERQFGLATYIEYVAGTDSQYLILNQYPIQDVEYVKMNGIEINSESYMILKDQGILLGRYGWGGSILYRVGFVTNIPVGYIPIYEVRYTAGYVLPEDTVNTGERLPEIIERVCIDIVKVLYHARKRDDAVQSEKLGDYSVSFKEGKLIEFLELLNRFKRTI